MKKILIIRFSSIGDIVLTSPVIRCIHQQTGAEIHYLTKASFLPILEYNPYLDKIFTIQKKVSEILPQLRKERYDLIIDLHKNLRSWQVRLAFFSVKTYAFDKLNFEKWLLVNFKINRLPKVHIVDRYLKTVENLNVKNDGRGLDFFLPKKPFFIHKNIPKKYIVFAIGAAHSTKRLPVEKIISICQKIQMPVLLIGGKDVEKEGELIRQQSKSNVQNFCGKLTILQSAQLIKNAEMVITHDTGMMHIAAAFQKKIVSIWGNTIPEFGMYPYYSKNINRNISIENQGLSCRPCSKIGFNNCPKGHFHCMKKIDSIEIIDRLND